MKYTLTAFITLLTTLCFGQTIIVEQKTNDTLIITEEIQTYKINKITRKAYIPPVIIPPPVQSKYFLLPVSNAKVITGQSNIVIENLRFDNATSVMIKITNSSNITIRNCFFNKGVSEAINIYQGTNIRIENCLFNAVTTGVLASTSTGIKVINNQFVNVKGPMPRGQFVQFNTVTGAGNEISGNKGENFSGECDPADLISLFKSSGTAASPILVKNNMFRGGGTLASGGGIVAGDYGGSYVTIDGNTLHTPGNYGLAIVGGSYNSITNNKVFSLQTPISNSSIHIWAQAGVVCSNNTIKGNRVYWINKYGVLNDGWNAQNCTNTVWEKPTRITEAELNMPSHLIDFITPTELLTIRK